MVAKTICVWQMQETNPKDVPIVKPQLLWAYRNPSLWWKSSDKYAYASKLKKREPKLENSSLPNPLFGPTEVHQLMITYSSCFIFSREDFTLFSNPTKKNILTS